MSKKLQDLSVDVTFVTKGINSLENKLVGLNNKAQTLKSQTSSLFSGVTASNIQGELDKTTRGLEATYNRVRDFKNKVKTVFNDLELSTGSGSSLEIMLGEIRNISPQNFEKLNSQFKRMSQGIGGYELSIKGFATAFSGTTPQIIKSAQANIKAMEDLGISASQSTRWSDKLSDALQKLEKTGDPKYLSAVNTQIKESLKNYKDLQTQIDKIQALGVVDPSANKEVKRLSILQNRVSAGTITTPDVTANLGTSKSIYGNLVNKQRELNGLQNESKNIINGNISALEKQAAAIQKTLDRKGTDITAASRRDAVAQISELNKKSEALKALLASMPSILKESDIVKFNQTVKSTIPDFENLVNKADLLNFNTGLSRNLRSAKVAAIDLTKELKIAVDTMSSGSTGALNQLQAQLKSLYGSLSSKQVSPAAAKEDLDVIAKKLELLKKIDDLESRAKLAGQGGIISSSDVTATIGKINDLRKEISSTSQLTGVLADKFNEINQAVSGKVKYDTAYDKIIASLIKQKEILENLIKVKERYASSGSLDAAAQQIDVLKKKIESAIISKDSFRQEFSVDSKGSINKATVELQKLGVELQSDAAHTDRLKRSLNEVPMSKWIQNIGQRALAYASLYAGMYQVFNLMSKGVAYTLEYDQAVHTLSAVLDMTAESAGRLENKLAKLSVQFGGSLKDINEAALTLGRAGFDKTEVATATENIIKMARLTGDTFATSASALITYKEVFGDVKDAVTGTTPSVEDLSNTLAYMANQSRMSTQDIGTFSNYALAAAKSSGMTADAVSSMAISFSNAGVNASTIGTQIRRFSSVLAETSTETVNFFKQAGVSQEIMMARMRMGTAESNKAMGEFVSKLKAMSDTEFSNITRGMDILALQSLTLLRNNADEFFRHMQKLNSGVEGEVDKASFVTESYAITWEKLGNSLGLAFNDTVGKLLPMAKSATDFIISALKTFNEVTTAVRDNWTAFKTVFFAITGSVAIFSLVKGISAISTGLAAAAVSGTLLTRALQLANIAMAAMAKHPIMLILGAAVVAATAISASFGEANKELDTMEDTLTRTQDKIRELMKLKDEATSVKIRAEIETRIVKTQAEVDKLTTAIAMNTAALDAKSAKENAQSLLLSYAEQKDPKIREIQGAKAQTAAVSSLDSYIAVYEKAIKNVENTDKALAQSYRAYLTYLESMKASIQAGDFKGAGNQANVNKLIKAFDDITTQTNLLNKAFQDTTNSFKSPKLSDNASPGGIPNALKKLTNLSLSERTGGGFSDGQQENIRFLSKILANLEGETKRNLQINSVLRARTDARMAANKNSPHYEAAAMDIQAKSREDAFQLAREIAKNPDLYRGVGQVIVERMKESGNYVVHVGKDLTGKGVSFQYSTVNKAGKTLGMTKYDPLNPNGKPIAPVTQSTVPKVAEIVKDPTATAPTAASGTITIMSPARLENLKKMASDYQSLYRSGVEDLSDGVRTTLSALQKGKEDLVTSRNDLIREYEKQALATSGLSKAGIALVKDFSTAVKSSNDDASLTVNIEAWEATVESAKKKNELNKEDLGIINAMQTSQAGIVQTQRDALKLDVDAAALRDMAIIKLNKIKNLTVEELEAKRAINQLDATLASSASRYKDILEKGYYYTSKMDEAKTKLSIAQNDLNKAKTTEVTLSGQLVNINKIIEEHNKAVANGTANAIYDENVVVSLKDRQAELVKELEEAQKAVNKSSENEIKLKNDLIILETAILVKSREYSAQYDSIVNKSGTQLANLQRIADLQDRINNDQNPTEATQQQTDIYNTKADDAKRNLGYSDFVSEGAGASTIQQQTALAEGITADYNAVYDQQLMAFKTFNERKAQIQSELATTNGGDMMPEADRLARLQELDQVELQAAAQKTAMLATENDKRVAHEQASFGIMLANTNTAFNGMQNIIQAASALGLIKSKAAAKAMQAVAVGQAIINTYVGANKALIEYPPPYSYVMAAGVIAQGMANVAQIKAQTFHTGGYVYDDNRAGLRSDEIPAVLQSGEYVLSRNDLKAIKETSGGSPAVASPQNSEVVVVNSLDPSIIEEYLTSRAGRQIINNSIKR